MPGPRRAAATTGAGTRLLFMNEMLKCRIKGPTPLAPQTRTNEKMEWEKVGEGTPTPPSPPPMAIKDISLYLSDGMWLLLFLSKPWLYLTLSFKVRWLAPSRGKCCGGNWTCRAVTTHFPPSLLCYANRMKTFSQKESLANKLVTFTRQLLQSNTLSRNGQLPRPGSPLLLPLFNILLPGARLGGLGWKLPCSWPRTNQCRKDLPTIESIAKSHLALEPLDLLSSFFFPYFPLGWSRLTADSQ